MVDVIGFLVSTLMAVVRSEVVSTLTGEVVRSEVAVLGIVGVVTVVVGVVTKSIFLK